ncbi:MAG: hypothetical protein KKF16_08810 [Euryarchaeota archaeon]|nr:hypothetical protein [Euryarchaeota archaeon]MBV1728685.1 hypothetical protein [Methanobacterium sp.]MBU4548206.1 hypothetical protein [Euryarchaeota archaeon]MBU4608917.1 hypothetical protein [Euryarchaeota archaeon]MBV1754771.1 hypothetical protein [Methanobacterium sp.]
MRFIKDTEKEQLKRLVKACMLEISKLKMDLKKCREQNNNGLDVQQSNSEIEINSDRVEELEMSLEEKDKTILELKQSLKDQDNRISDLEEIKSYFEALTAKPKRDLTSFQSQVYMLLPSEKASTEKMHSIIKKIGFKELSIDNMFHILRNLERKGYFSSERINDIIIWKKIEK